MDRLKSAAFSNLLLLGFDPKKEEQNNLMSFNKNMFDVPNHKAFQVVFHFLITKCESPDSGAAVRLKFCWPVQDRGQESEFRKTIVAWLTSISAVPSNHVEKPSSVLFMSPGGEALIKVLFRVTNYLLRKMTLEKYGGSEQMLSKPVTVPSISKQFSSKQTSTSISNILTLANRSLMEQFFVDVADAQSKHSRWKEQAERLSAQYHEAVVNEKLAVKNLKRVGEIGSLEGLASPGPWSENLTKLVIEKPPTEDKNSIQSPFLKTPPHRATVHHSQLSTNTALLRKQYSRLDEFMNHTEVYRQAISKHHILLNCPPKILNVSSFHSLPMDCIRRGKNREQPDRLDLNLLFSKSKIACDALIDHVPNVSPSIHATSAYPTLKALLSLHSDNAKNAELIRQELSEQLRLSCTSIEELSCKLQILIASRSSNLVDNIENRPPSSKHSGDSCSFVVANDRVEISPQPTTLTTGFRPLRPLSSQNRSENSTTVPSPGIISPIAFSIDNDDDDISIPEAVLQSPVKQHISSPAPIDKTMQDKKDNAPIDDDNDNSLSLLEDGPLPQNVCPISPLRDGCHNDENDDVIGYQGNGDSLISEISINLDDSD